MVLPKLRRVKPFLYLFTICTPPKLQKKAVLSHVSLIQLEAICEIAHNITKIKVWCWMWISDIHKLMKKNMVISILANKKANSSKKVALIKRKWLSILRMLYLIRDLIKQLLVKVK